MTSDVAADTVPARADAPDTRVRLLTAAREIICEVGFKRARMEDIAARAGVSRAAVYYHFNTKRDLAAAIADDVFERLTATVRAALSDGPVEGVIAATVRFVVERSGQITQAEVEQSSGVPILDRASLRAVLLADPLPPLPNSYPRDQVGVHLRFTYSDQ